MSQLSPSVKAPKSKKSYKRKILLILLVLTIIIAPILYIFGPRIIMLYTLNVILKDKNPNAVNSKLMQLKLPTSDNISYKETLSYCSIKFKNPFTKLSTIKNITKGETCIYSLTFESGLELGIMDWGDKLDFKKLILVDYPKANKYLPEYFKNLGNYEIGKRIFEVQPTSLSVLTPTDVLNFEAVLSVTKGAFLTAHKTDSDIIYYFDTENFKGFQFSQPEKSSRVDLQIFYSNNKVMDLIFKGRTTQAELNALLSTIVIK